MYHRDIILYSSSRNTVNNNSMEAIVMWLHTQHTSASDPAAASLSAHFL